MLKISEDETIFKRPDRKLINVSMEDQPDMGMLQVNLQCDQCERLCVLSFMSREKLRYASVGKLAAVFSSLCGKLAKAQNVHKKQDGQLNLMSSAGE